MKCSKCGAELDSKWKACPFCGEVVNSVKTCPSCNNEVQSGWKTCPYCAKSLEENSYSYSDFSNNYNGGTSFVDFEKTYKMNKEEEERIAREKEEKERLARLKAEQEEKERKAREAKLAAERAEKERKERERQEQLAKERAIKAEKERINSLIANGSIPSLSSDRKTVTFGKYHFTRYGDPVSEVLEWKVLSINNGIAFVVLKRPLDKQMAYDVNGGLSWSNSTIRKWLNGEFYTQTFDSEAAKYTVGASSVEGCTDTIFVLNKNQVEYAPYGLMNGSYVSGVTNTWLAGTDTKSEMMWNGGYSETKGVSFIDSCSLITCESATSFEKKVWPAMLIKLP